MTPEGDVTARVRVVVFEKPTPSPRRTARVRLTVVVPASDETKHK
jgi:hypothetical protein